jgi:hypothetical protein
MNHGMSRGMTMDLTPKEVIELIMQAGILLAFVWFGKWYRDAKEAQINTLQSRIDMLEKLTPVFWAEQLEGIQKLTKSSIDGLTLQINDTKEKLSIEQGARLASDQQLVENNEKLNKINCVLESTIRERDALKQSLDQGSPPSLKRVITAVSSSHQLSEFSATVAPIELNELRDALQRMSDQANIAFSNMPPAFTEMARQQAKIVSSMKPISDTLYQATEKLQSTLGTQDNKTRK